ncbi:lysophospholipase-like protein II [Ochromonadaceae sp. CCMP2298]|nr:lysophospholipase-like protein II [Ochromonadaceae sp. CCMP2298]|eukprot:CAMPEP_0173198396 /NCGR_PEP_ID=MMETSP1141-20130122/16664_1 /TAXON_ID=483371 /ORGANISM="non described non described, Strain CCMP2298" /LENGTH=229 /DNA_ID=CAMNT_0014123185 /DNA_START=71 /DNA_END=760 /DNA_ORIENTATION=+
MKTVRADGIGGRGITYVPKSGEYSGLLIFLHGLGDTADGWASLMPSLGLKDTKIVLPTADTIPISLNGGMPMPGWSDIYGLSDTDKEDEAGFNASAARVMAIVQQEIDSGKVLPSKVVLAGFSQGGAVALHTSMRCPLALGGVVALSTWLPVRASYPEKLSATASSLRIMQAHGDEDRVVGYKWGKNSHELLKTMVSTPPAFHTIRGMGHSSDPGEMELVKAFLQSILS